MRRRLLSLLLVLVMVIGMIPSTVFAAESQADPSFTITVGDQEITEVDAISGATFNPSYEVTLPAGTETYDITFGSEVSVIPYHTGDDWSTYHDSKACKTVGYKAGTTFEDMPVDLDTPDGIADELSVEDGNYGRYYTIHFVYEIDAASVIAKIEAIGEVTLESEDAINEARSAYDKLSDEQKKSVTNYATLTAAEAALAELKNSEQSGIPFTVTVNGDPMTQIATGELTLQNGSKEPLYTVTVPTGTKEATIAWGTGASMYYSYNAAGLVGFAENLPESSTVDIDANDDGAYDRFQVYAGATVIYNITFASEGGSTGDSDSGNEGGETDTPAQPDESTIPFTAAVGGEGITEIVEGIHTNYGQDYKLYTITVPYGTETVTLTWDQEVVGFSTDATNDDCWDFWDEDPHTTIDVSVDGNEDGVIDYLYVSEDLEWMDEEQTYWITFVEAESPQPSSPFTASVGGEAITEIVEGIHTNYGQNYKLYTITVPYGTETVTLTWDQEVVGFSTDATNDDCWDFWDDDPHTTIDVSVDGNEDGILDYLIVSEDVEWNDETKSYWITFTSGAAEENPEVTTYSVTVADAENGAVTADKDTAAEGETVTLTVTPADGYALDALSVMNGETEVAVTDNTFVMPAGEVTVTATFIARWENPYTDVDAYWPNFRNSLYNMAVTDTETPASAATTVEKWVKAFGNGWSSTPSGMIIADDALIFMTGSTLKKVDLQTGDLIKEVTMSAGGGFVIISPTYADGLIFCPQTGGKIEAFDVRTLESVWTFADALGGQNNTAITYADGYLYTGFWSGEAKDGNYVCVDATTGKLVWSKTVTGGFYWAGSTVVGDAVIFGSDDGTTGFTGDSHLYALNKLTGEEITDITLTGMGDMRSSVAYSEEKGRVYFTTKNGYIASVAVDAETGALSDLKSSKVASQATSTPVVCADKVFFGAGGGMQTGSTAGNYFVADADTLEGLYEIPLLGYPQSSTMVSTAYQEETGKLYCYTTYNNKPGGLTLIKIDPTVDDISGAEIEEVYAAPGHEQYCLISPICGSDGTVYYRNDSGYIFALTTNEAYLTGLSADVGTFSAEFGANVLSYELVVPIGTETVTLTPTACEGGSAEAVNVTLVDGKAEATVTVTNGDDSRSYTVSIREVSSNTALGELKVNEGNSYTSTAKTLTPEFAADTYYYGVFDVGSSRNFENVWPTAADTNATVKVYALSNIREDKFDAETGEITGGNGVNVRYPVYFADDTLPMAIRIEVTAENGEIANYYLVMSKEAAAEAGAELLETLQKSNEPVSATIKGMHSAQISSVKLYTYTNGVTGETDLLEGVETNADGYMYLYNTELTPGDYWAEGYDANGDCNGGIKLTVTADGENVFYLQRVYQIYATNSGWVLETDYTIDVKVTDQQRNEREITTGTANSWGTVYTSCLFIYGDTVEATLTPIGERAETCMATTISKTGTANMYISGKISESLKMTFVVPEGSTVDVGKFSAYYIYNFYEQTENPADLELEEGMTAYTFNVPKDSVNVSSGPYFFYRVQNEEGVTYWDFFAPATYTESAATVTLTAEQLFIDSTEFTSDTIYHNYEKNIYDTADIYLNINGQGYMDMDVGETFELNVFRNWMAIESFYNRRVALPDMDYEVITVDGSNVITVEKDANNSSVATLTATGEGTAIVLVTYDAMYSNCAYVSGTANQPGYFSAIWPENTGVFVVTVGKDGTSIETGMTIDRNGTTGALDAEHDHLYYLGSEGASYTFAPEAGTTVTVNRSTVSSTEMTFGSFVSDGVTVNEDGSVTVSGLTEGRHIVKVEKDGTANYQVITAKQTTYELQDADGNALTEEQIAAIGAGDTVYVQFSGLANPCEKMSGVYNHAPAVLYVGEDGTSFTSSKTSGIGVYGFGGTPSLQNIVVTIPKYWTADSYTIGGYIRMNTSGSGVGAHRGVTYAKGMNANFNATVGSNVLCELPEITFSLAGTEFLTGKLEFVDQNGDAVTADLSVSMTDADGNVVDVNEDYTFGCLAGEYSFIINGAGVQYYTGSVTVTEDGDNVFTVTLTTTGEGAWDGITVTEPAQDENGVYLISNGAEMIWFAQQNQNNKANISGKLTADIDLACYPWNNTLTFANYATVLDGAGHSITNLNATRGIFGALGANSSVKDLTIYGTVSGGSSVGALVSYINGANTVIENVVNYATVSGTGSSGGIAGYASSGITIRNCVNHGAVSSTGSSVGGIIGSTGTTTIEGCYNTAAISGTNYVGGIYGYTSAAANVVACYNTGDISGTSYVGGVGGNLDGPYFGTATASLRDCYSTGTVTGTGSNIGGALGYYNSAKAAVERLYYLEGAYNSDPVATVLTSEQLKCAELDPEYFGGTCFGYPALLWQTDVTFHSTEGEGEVTAPTCTEKGYTTYTCDACGVGYNVEYVDATGHAWCEDTEGCDNCVYTAPTCTEDGSIVRTCLHEGCEEPKTDVIPATGHTEDENQTVDHEIYKDCVCSVCGESYRVWDDERLQHMTLDMSVLSAITLEDNTYPWSYNASTERFESTNKGVNSSTSQTSVIVTLTDAANVSFNYGVSSEANYDKLTITAASGETVIATIANAISGTQESAFTYELPAGTYTLTFAYTKDSSSAGGSDIGWFSDVVIASNHTHSYEAVVTDPTCTEGGYTTYTCECGDGYTADETAALGHSYVAGVCTGCGVEDPDYVPAEVSVYLSISDDADFVAGETSGEVMALKKITVPYFDLGLYGLEDYYFSTESYGDDGDGQPGSDLAPGTAAYAEGKITMMHLYIYATEVYYCGIDESEAGKGYLYNEQLLGTETLEISGSSGSTFMDNFWGMDMNLNYYLNYEYPLASAGWGATADQILLENGDIVTLGHFTSWDFHSDPASVFNYIADGEKTITTTATEGDHLELTVYRAGADFNVNYETAHTAVASEPEVFYVPADGITSGTVSAENGWTLLGKANTDGTITLDTSMLEPGEYIIAIAGQYGAEYTDVICSTPGGIILTLEACTHSEYDPVVTPATCTEGGYTTYTCKQCGHTYTADETDALGHTEVVDEAVDATCTETGLTEGKHCSVCEEVLVAQEVVPAKGHTDADKDYICDSCDADLCTEHVEAVTPAVAPTCTETGLTEGKHCSVCNEVLVAQEVVPATGVHTYASEQDEACEQCGVVLTVAMLRLYNPNNGEHFYTGSEVEKDTLVAAGWKYEGVAWNAPVHGGVAIHRLYNPNTGDHHYTGSQEEVDILVAAGWSYEGVAFNTPQTGLPVYRLYNPNAVIGSHHYTMSAEERDILVAAGWKYEGVAWNGVAD